MKPRLKLLFVDQYKYRLTLNLLQFQMMQQIIKLIRNMYLLRIQLVAIYVMAPITKMNANGKPKTIRRSSAYLFKKLFMSKFNINDIIFFVEIAISSNEWPK